MPLLRQSRLNKPNGNGTSSSPDKEKMPDNIMMLTRADLKEMEELKEQEEFRVKLFQDDIERNYKISTEDIAMALRDCDGFIAKAAIKLGIHFNTILKRVQTSAYLQRILESIKEASLDYTESQLKKAIRKGNMSAIIFTLKCQGRHRGWIEQLDVAGVPGKPIKFEYRLVLPDGFNGVQSLTTTTISQGTPPPDIEEAKRQVEDI